MREVVVGSIAELAEEARKYISRVMPQEQAYAVGLAGNLGAGKTAFVKEVAKLLGIEEDITSPTFVIEKNYSIDFQGFRTLVHIDAYRLESGEDMRPLKFEETLANKENLLFIEWPEHILSALPKDMEKIEFETVSESERKLIFYDREN